MRCGARVHGNGRSEGRPIAGSLAAPQATKPVTAEQTFFRPGLAARREPEGNAVVLQVAAHETGRRARRDHCRSPQPAEHDTAYPHARDAQQSWSAALDM